MKSGQTVVRRILVNLDLSEKDLRLADVLFSKYALQQGLVKTISNGKSYDVSRTDQVIGKGPVIVKVEGMEYFSHRLEEACATVARLVNHSGRVSCHVFASSRGSISFPMHVDLDDVVVYMLSGEKVFETPHGNFTLSTGEALHIPAGAEHRAINTHDSIMLSFGIETYIGGKI